MKKANKFGKVLCSAMAIGMIMSVCAVPGMAASATEGSDASLETAFTFEYKNDPTYTVTIPSAVTLTEDGVEVAITAENVANLDGSHVSVTIAGTDKYRNQMLLEGKTDAGKNASLRYQFIFEDGTVIETTGGKDQVNGVELASFTEDGSETFTVKPVLTGSSSIVKGVTYTGSMTYGIALVD